jgi:hypothetical protein
LHESSWQTYCPPQRTCFSAPRLPVLYVQYPRTSHNQHSVSSRLQRFQNEVDIEPCGTGHSNYPRAHIVLQFHDCREVGRCVHALHEELFFIKIFSCSDCQSIDFRIQSESRINHSFKNRHKFIKV